MVAIIAWGNDLTFKPCNGWDDVYRFKRIFGSETDIIPYYGQFACPIRMDRSSKQLTEEEQIEWLMTDVYPQLVDDGIMKMVNGKYRWIKSLNGNGGQNNVR